MSRAESLTSNLNNRECCLVVAQRWRSRQWFPPFYVCAVWVFVCGRTCSGIWMHLSVWMFWVMRQQHHFSVIVIFAHARPGSGAIVLLTLQKSKVHMHLASSSDYNGGSLFWRFFPFADGRFMPESNLRWSGGSHKRGRTLGLNEFHDWTRRGSRQPKQYCCITPQVPLCRRSHAKTFELAAAWIGGPVDQVRASKSKYLNKELKVPEDCFCGWIDGVFTGVVTTLDVAKDYKGQNFKHQVKLTVHPGRFKYIVVTTSTNNDDFVIERLEDCQRQFLAVIGGKSRTMQAGGQHNIVYMRNPPYFYNKDRGKKMVSYSPDGGGPSGKIKELTEEDKMQVMTVVSPAYTGMRGEVREKTMALVSNFFNVQVPEEAL